MKAKRPGVLDPLRVRVRRFQLIVGLGLIACVLGAVISIPISMRVLPGLTFGPALFEIVRTLISQLWAWAVLPALLYGVARIIELRPWSSSIGGVVTGLVFTLSIVLISRGFEGITSEHPARLVMMVLTAVAGVLLSSEAVRRARAAAQRAEEQARKAAEARKDEYAEFAREAERIAAMNEARATAGTAASGSSGEAPASEALGPDASHGAAPSEAAASPAEPPSTAAELRPANEATASAEVKPENTSSATPRDPTA